MIGSSLQEAVFQMEQSSPDASQRLRSDEEFDVRGARNISKLEKLESERTQRTTSRSVTTNDQHGKRGNGQFVNGDEVTDSPEILIDDSEQQRKSESGEWSSKRAEQRSDTHVGPTYSDLSSINTHL